jgi:hypothetical protein
MNRKWTDKLHVHQFSDPAVCQGKKLETGWENALHGQAMNGKAVRPLLIRSDRMNAS